MNTYNMDKMYESFAGSMETMQRWLDESEQENKQLKDKIDKAIEYLENHSLYEEEYDYDYEENSYLSGIDDETAKKDLLKILKEEE